MIVHTKRFKGDALRTYKVLMRKLNKEGFYQESKKKEHFKSKGEVKREKLARSVAKEQKRQKLKEMQLQRAEFGYKKKKVKQR
jgi:hypothetical protein